jgi:hypothetical protein
MPYDYPKATQQLAVADPNIKVLDSSTQVSLKDNIGAGKYELIIAFPVGGGPSEVYSPKELTQETYVYDFSKVNVLSIESVLTYQMKDEEAKAGRWVCRNGVPYHS